MIVLLVVLTFLVAIVIDHLVLRQPLLVREEETPETMRLVPPVVAGFNLPDNLRYHPGHTWAVAETPELVRVGVDDFAAKVAGGVSKIDVPVRGQWIRQGQKIIAMQKNGFEVDLVSPIEGTVVDINDAVLTDPNVTRTDPYGRGWLLKVNSPDAKTNFRNLLDGNVARRWMEDAAGKLRGLIATPKLATAHDGGMASDDLLEMLPAEQRENAARELFLIA